MQTLYQRYRLRTMNYQNRCTRCRMVRVIIHCRADVLPRLRPRHSIDGEIRVIFAVCIARFTTHIYAIERPLDGGEVGARAAKSDRVTFGCNSKWIEGDFGVH